MTLHTYPEIEQGTEEWFEQRRGLVTASVVGKLITTKTLKTASNDESRGVTAQLVAERITGWSDPTYMTADMQRGHDIEPIARDWYAERNGVTVEQLGFMVREFTMPWNPNETVRSVDETAPTYRIGYSPDGLVGDDGLIEVKAPRAKTHLTTHLSGLVPLHHMAQIQAGLLVADRQWCDFISFYGGMSPFVKRVHRDEKWAKAIVEAVELFESKATQMQSDYERLTAGSPKTERLLIDMDMVI